MDKFVIRSPQKKKIHMSSDSENPQSTSTKIESEVSIVCTDADRKVCEPYLELLEKQEEKEIENSSDNDDDDDDDDEVILDSPGKIEDEESKENSAEIEILEDSPEAKPRSRKSSRKRQPRIAPIFGKLMQEKAKKEEEEESDPDDYFAREKDPDFKEEEEKPTVKRRSSGIKNRKASTTDDNEEEQKPARSLSVQDYDPKSKANEWQPGTFLVEMREIFRKEGDDLIIQEKKPHCVWRIVQPFLVQKYQLIPAKKGSQKDAVITVQGKIGPFDCSEWWNYIQVEVVDQSEISQKSRGLLEKFPQGIVIRYPNEKELNEAKARMISNDDSDKDDDN